MTLDIEKIKDAAMAATWGEWSSYGTLVYLNVYGGFDLHASPNPINNATHIATANPQAVLELISRLEAAEKQRDELLSICERVVERGIGSSDVKAMKLAIASVKESEK